MVTNGLGGGVGLGGRPGPGMNPATTTLTLRPASGTLELTILKRKEVVAEGVYDSGEQVPTRDVARRHRMWPRGAGWSSRPGGLEAGEEWDGFAEGENICARFGYICPSGEQTTEAVTPSWGGASKFLSFNGDLFCIFGGMVARKPGGTAAMTPVLAAPAGDTFLDAAVWDNALRVALLCTHTGANIHFFATIRPSGGSYTMTNPTPAAPDGTPATAATPQLRLVETVFWRYQGQGGTRLLGQTGDYGFRYMITPTGDPYDAANWGPGVQVGDRTYPIRRIVSSYDTAWFLKRDGVYAVTDANASAGGENLTPYWADTLDPTDAWINGCRWGRWIVASHASGVDLFDVDSWQVRDRPVPASVGWGRPNTTAFSGVFTAFTTDAGWLVGAMRGAGGNAYILYGAQRQRESPSAGMTYVDWFPEVGPIGGDRDVTALGIHAPGPSGRPTLYVGLVDQTGQLSVVAVEGFNGPSPLADAGHRYNTAASVTFTDEHWAARAATKGALRGELSVRNCGGGRRIDLYAAAGAGSPFVEPVGGVSDPVETRTFAMTGLRGSVIRSKAVLISTPTVPVVLDEWGMKANLGFPLRNRGTWDVVLSDGTETALPDRSTPSRVEQVLVGLCASVEAFVAVDDEGHAMTVVLDNQLEWRRVDVPTTDLGIRPKDRVLRIGWQRVDG